MVDGEDGAVREMRAGVRHHQLHRVQQRVVVQQQETEIFIALEAGVVKEREGREVCGVNGEGEIGVDDGALVAGDHKEYEGREGESDLRDVERQTLLGRVGILVADDGHARDVQRERVLDARIVRVQRRGREGRVRRQVRGRRGQSGSRRCVEGELRRAHGQRGGLGEGGDVVEVDGLLSRERRQVRGQLCRGVQRNGCWLGGRGRGGRCSWSWVAWQCRGVAASWSSRWYCE